MTGTRIAGSRGGIALVRALPVVAIVVAVVVVGAVLASAGPTLGYDTHAYLDAARRLLDGGPIYDTTIDRAGAAGLYYYSPPFTLLAVPFALLPAPLDVVAWAAGLIAAFAIGVAILPVARNVRWAIVLLAGCRGRSPTRSSWARSARSCSCCSPSAGAGWTARSGSGSRSRSGP